MDMEKNKKRIETMFWGGLMLWAGLVFIAANLGLFSMINLSNVWKWILIGAGALALASNLFRSVSSEYPNPSAWDWIFTAGFLIGGLSGFTAINFDYVWPIILIIIGGVMLVRVVMNRE
jgi:uncharacterized membrane protein YfcA